MTLQQMEYIVALDKYRHFAQAAESCGVTQPTLSAMVQKLEDELDIRIFDRDKKRVIPTAIGVKVIHQAATVLNESQRVKELISDEIGLMTGTLSVGILPTVAPYLVPDFIANFKKRYPSVTLHIEEMDQKALLHALELGTIDMAISTPPKNLVRCLEIPLYKERFVAYISELCQAKRFQFDAQNLVAEHMWILKEGHCLHNEAFSFCQDKAVGNHIYEAGSIDTLIRIVDRNGGYTVIPELHTTFLSERQRKNVQELDMTPPAERTISMLIKTDFIRERMVNAVGEVIKEIIPIKMMDERFVKFAIKLK